MTAAERRSPQKVINSLQAARRKLCRWSKRHKRCGGAAGLVCEHLKGSPSRLISEGKTEEEEMEGEDEEEDEEVGGGTCSGALAKSPIITSKPDSAAGSLRGTGAQRKMKRCTEIRVKSAHRQPPSPPASSPSLSTSSLSSTCPDFPYRFPFLAPPRPPFIASSLPRLICACSTWPPLPRTRRAHMRSLSPLPFPFLLADFLHPLSGL